VHLQLIFARNADNLIKRTKGNLSRKTPRSQKGSLRVEGSVWGGRRIRKRDERPTQRHIVTGIVSEDRTWHSTLGDLTKVKKNRKLCNTKVEQSIKIYIYVADIEYLFQTS